MKNNAHQKITSVQNPRIKTLIHLHKKRARDRAGLILIEGLREIRMAVESGIVIREVYYCPDLVDPGDGNSLLREIEGDGHAVLSVNRRIFSKIAYREDSGGFVIAAERPDRALEDLEPPPAPLYLVVDAVEKPGNLGAMLRSADAAGAAGLIVSDPATDVYNPNIIRSSLGTVFTVPVAAAGAAEVIEWLRKRNIRILPATPKGGTLYTGVDLASPCAIVVGREDLGVSEIWLEAADQRLQIHMKGRADSLNVSAAAAVLLFEAVRQRT